MRALWVNGFRKFTAAEKFLTSTLFLMITAVPLIPAVTGCIGHSGNRMFFSESCPCKGLGSVTMIPIERGNGKVEWQQTHTSSTFVSLPAEASPASSKWMRMLGVIGRSRLIISEKFSVPIVERISPVPLIPEVTGWKVSSDLCAHKNISHVEQCLRIKFLAEIRILVAVVNFKNFGCEIGFCGGKDCRELGACFDFYLLPHPAPWALCSFQSDSREVML